MAEANRAPVIPNGRIKLAEYERQDWIANIEYGTTPEDVVRPSYWALVASQMKPYDHIEARAEDGSWIAYLIVTGCDRVWARVAVDRIIKLTTQDVALSQQVSHEVVWKGPQHKFSVIRLSDQERIKDGFQSKDDASTWLKEYERTVSA